MKDCQGIELKFKDKIAYIPAGGYIYLRTGYVLGFTPKMIKVTSNPDILDVESHDYILREPQQVCKISS